jgi:hypothetical protein
MNVNDIHTIRVKLDQFVGDMDINVIEALSSVEDKITQLNRTQLLQSKGFDGNDLVNERTGSPYLSKQYGRRTGKTKPNLFVNGDFQKGMFTQMDNIKEYFVSSYHWLVKYLPDQYKNGFGIAKENQPIARQIWKDSFRSILSKKVGI